MIYAGVNGYLDPLPVNRVRAFEDGVLAGLRSEKTILDAIAKEKALSADSEKKLERRRQVSRRVLRLIGFRPMNAARRSA